MTLVGWMVQTTVLGALFSGAALLAERLPVRRRWAWLMAVTLSAAVPLVALLAPAVWPEWLRWRVAPELPLSAAATSSGGAARLASGRGPMLDPVPIAWVVLSLLCLTRYVAGWLRLRWLSRGWVGIRVAGCDLLVSERIGPAVVGLWRPRVVAPRWILAASAARQRMIVMHEAEHVRAGDQWVLAAAPLLALLLPWNVWLWWQLRRLRLAVELDCDARVLSRGVRPLEYGGLLLDVAGSDPVAVPALAEPRSLLERRLEAVVGGRRRPGVGRCAALAAAAVLAVVTGCLAAAPVRVVTTRAAATPVVPAPARTESVVASGAAAARQTPREADRARGRTTPRNDGATASNHNDASRIARVPLGVSVVGELTGPIPGPLLIVDGVIVAGGSLERLQLDPADIDRIAVFKGAAAAAQYGPRGADGVVEITTKRGGAPR